MEPFSLEKYLEKPSRKVVTRLKKSAQIISIEGKEDIPIVALVEGVAHQYKPNGYHADVVVAYSNQCRDMGDYDLFFADEEELTEFEKMLRYVLECYSGHEFASKSEIVTLKLNAKSLLDLARKELEPELDKKLKDAYNQGGLDTQEEITKSLPKWKKCDDNLPYSHIGGLNERYLIKNGYCIKISDLETLPKEE